MQKLGLSETLRNNSIEQFDPVRLTDRQPVSNAEQFPAGHHPYYIVTPRYVRTSAGIKATHILCHCLNRVGQEAYLVIVPPWPGRDKTCPDLLTPILTHKVLARHRAQGLSPIVVYPETIPGNPLGARSIVRYLLNFPGLLVDGAEIFPGDVVYAYSKTLAEAGGVPQNILFIPVSDTETFSPEPGRPRRGGCFWAAKYRMVHGGEPLPITNGCQEITRDLPDSPTPAQIAELFRRSEVFYTYENTALAIEAALCLCPTVFLPNPWLTEAIGAKELGWDGYAWGTEPAEIARAKATVHLARERYLQTYAQFWDQLSGFVARTQARAAEDAQRYGFPERMFWHSYWRDLAALRSRVPPPGLAARAILRRLRRRAPTAPLGRSLEWAGRKAIFSVVLVRVTATVLWREGPVSVMRKAYARLSRSQPASAGLWPSEEQK